MYMPSARQWGKYCSVGRTELHWGTVGRAWPQASPGTAHGWPGRDKVQEPGRVGTLRLGSRAWGCWVAADLGSSKQPNSGNTAELGAIGDPHHRGQAQALPSVLLLIGQAHRESGSQSPQVRSLSGPPWKEAVLLRGGMAREEGVRGRGVSEKEWGHLGERRARAPMEDRRERTWGGGPDSG